MNRRNVERALRRMGWRRDDRFDHREWRHPRMLAGVDLRVFLDTDRTGIGKLRTEPIVVWRVGTKLFQLGRVSDAEFLRVVQALMKDTP